MGSCMEVARTKMRTAITTPAIVPRTTSRRSASERVGFAQTRVVVEVALEVVAVRVPIWMVIAATTRAIATQPTSRKSAGGHVDFAVAAVAVAAVVLAPTLMVLASGTKTTTIARKQM